MKRQILIACTVLLAAAQPGYSAPSERPNIVIILSDDQGYADVGFNPHHGPGIITPNIDKIARDGVIFEQGYITASMCLPSRAALLTGRYQQRAGVHWAEVASQPVRLLADYLKEAGYVSGAFGKWHETGDIAGDLNPTAPPTRVVTSGDLAVDLNPTKRGFDEFYGFNHGGRDYYDLDNTASDFAPLFRGTKCLKGTGEKGYLTHRLTDEAVDFIKRHRDQPFLVYLPYNAVHTPLQAQIEDVEVKHKYSTDPARKILLAMINYLDTGVGRILDTLKEEGLYENTLIFFLTDNGGSVLATHADNTPLRGEKLQNYEGGIRVPFVLSWPAAVKGGRTFAAPVSSLDIVPTCLAAAGIPQPASPRLDGINLLPLIDDKAAVAPPERDLFWWWKSGVGRPGGTPPPLGGGWAMRSGNWKLLQDSGDNPPPVQLFDLAADPKETTDLAKARPDLVADLKKRFDAWAVEVEADASRARAPKDSAKP
ncbi:MAG: N-acetylgalactosamine 6-sulfatase (GALNS) [Chthoniobacterales bacterium]|nr:N-acetylgalactosamine 6-sulfatase (GALNS) [Chthoniobacterales bacterium]